MDLTLLNIFTIYPDFPLAYRLLSPAHLFTDGRGSVERNQKPKFSRDCNLAQLTIAVNEGADGGGHLSNLTKYLRIRAPAELPTASGTAERDVWNTYFLLEPRNYNPVQLLAACTGIAVEGTQFIHTYSILYTPYFTILTSALIRFPPLGWILWKVRAREEKEETRRKRRWRRRRRGRKLQLLLAPPVSWRHLSPACVLGSPPPSMTWKVICLRCAPVTILNVDRRSARGHCIHVMGALTPITNRQIARPIGRATTNKGILPALTRLSVSVDQPPAEPAEVGDTEEEELLSDGEGIRTGRARKRSRPEPGAKRKPKAAPTPPLTEEARKAKLKAKNKRKAANRKAKNAAERAATASSSQVGAGDGGPNPVPVANNTPVTGNPPKNGNQQNRGKKRPRPESVHKMAPAEVSISVGTLPGPEGARAREGADKMSLRVRIIHCLMLSRTPLRFNAVSDVPGADRVRLSAPSRETADLISSRLRENGFDPSSPDDLPKRVWVCRPFGVEGMSNTDVVLGLCRVNELPDDSLVLVSAEEFRSEGKGGGGPRVRLWLDASAVAVSYIRSKRCYLRFVTDHSLRVHGPAVDSAGRPNGRD